MTFSVSGHEIKLEDKTAEEIINARMKQMNIINKLTTNIYKKLNPDNFKMLKEETIKLKHAASEFKELFPINSKSENTKELIWEDKELFEVYNNNFIEDINFMLISIDQNNFTSLKKSFDDMAAQCGICHKKFKKYKK